MKPKHVVIIEDDEDIINIQREVLEQAGYRVTPLHSVQSLEALLNLNADCFLIDEQLPFVSGHIICIYLRSKPVTAHIPVILVSAHPKLDHYSELCGANAWLSKPFDLQQLLDMVEGVLAKTA